MLKNQNTQDSYYLEDLEEVVTPPVADEDGGVQAVVVGTVVLVIICTW